MKEDILLKIALITAIIGIVILYLASQRLESTQATINRIDGVEDGSVVISGDVLSIDERNSSTLLRIQTTDIVPVVAFGKVPLVAIGDLVQVRGKLAKYNGTAEVTSEEIRVI